MPKPHNPHPCVVITGAASGIGRALALRFGKDGARVVLLDRDTGGAQLVADAIRATRGNALALPCDVTDEAQCKSAMAQARERFGGIDVLINNAGISHRSLFADTEPEVIRRVMDVNFFGAVHCTQAALPDLRSRSGVVVAISSIAGFAPLLGRTGYAASKHALHGFFDSLRTEVEEDGVSVLVVCPSFTDTAITRNAVDGAGEPIDRNKSTVGKLMTPEAVANIISDAVHHRRRQIVLTPVGKLSYLLSRCAPRVYANMMKRQMRAEFP